MAYEEQLQTVSLAADEDLSSKQYFFLALSTDGQAKVVATRGGTAFGVNQEKSSAAGISTKIAIGGLTKVAAGDTSGGSAIVPGDMLMSSSVGRAVPTTLNIGDLVLGQAVTPLSSAVTGTITMRYIGPRPSSS